MTLTLHRPRPAPAAAPTTSRQPGGEQLATDARYHFWLSYMRLGFAVMAAVSVVDIFYALLASRPHPGVVCVVSAADTFGGLTGLVLAPLAARWRRRAQFTELNSMLVGLATTLATSADNGTRSPLLFLILLPVVFAAGGLRPKAVARVAACALAEMAALGVTDQNTPQAGWYVLLVVAFAAGLGVIAVVTASQRQRLEGREREMEASLRRSALVDDLTDTLAYHPFQQRLTAEISTSVHSQEPLALIACDLDDLRSFNSVYGEVAGDAAIKDVAQALYSIAGGADLIGRTGGDELQMLCPNRSLDEAAALARKALELWRAPGRAVSLSVGVAQLDRVHPTVIRLLRDVDAALVEAKSRGGNTVVTTGELAGAPAPSDPRDGTDPGAHKRLDAAVRHARRQADEMRGVMFALVGGASAGFAFIGRDEQLRLANETMLAISGSTEPDPVGKQAANAVPYLWQRLERPFNDVIRTGAAVTDLEIAATAHGQRPTPDTPQAWLVNLYPVRTGADVIGVGVIAVDITDRKLLERASHDLTEAVVRALAATAEARDPYTAGHQSRVAGLSVAIATGMNINHDDISGIRLAATIHDIGKVAVPAELLARPGKLHREEFALIQTHAQAGYDILHDIPFPWPVADMVRQHHERLDGSGYPLGLRGNEILQGARIIAVADVIEAMAAYRPYRPRLGVQTALDEVLTGRGTRFDPDAVDACIALYETHQLEAYLQDETNPATPY